MKEIEVGLRIDTGQKLSFFGIDEVNKLLACNAKVIAIEPGGAITRKVKNNDGNVHLTISGFILIIKLMESGTS